MPRFTDQNTEGYSADDLACLNDQFDREVARQADAMAAMDDDVRKSHEDHIAELILAEFDAQQGRRR
jgi:hypothetical protein